MIAQPFEVPRTLRLLAEASPAGRAGPRDPGARCRSRRSPSDLIDRERELALLKALVERVTETGSAVADPRCPRDREVGARRGPRRGPPGARGQDPSGVRDPGRGEPALRRPAPAPSARPRRARRAAAAPATGDRGRVQVRCRSAAGSIPDRDRDPRTPLDGRAPGSGDRRRRRAVAGPTHERGALVRCPPGLVRSDRAARHGPG